MSHVYIDIDCIQCKKNRDGGDNGKDNASNHQSWNRLYRRFVFWLYVVTKQIWRVMKRRQRRIAKSGCVISRFRTSEHDIWITRPNDGRHGIHVYVSKVLFIRHVNLIRRIVEVLNFSRSSRHTFVHDVNSTRLVDCAGSEWNIRYLNEHVCRILISREKCAISTLGGMIRHVATANRSNNNSSSTRVLSSELTIDVSTTRGISFGRRNFTTVTHYDDDDDDISLSLLTLWRRINDTFKKL